MMTRDLGPVRTEPLFDLVADLAERLDLGATPAGRRIFDGVRGGRFEGPRLRGELLPGSGGDWGLYGADRTQRIDARLVLRTDDGALIYVTYRGYARIPADVRPLLADRARWHLVDPARYHIRSAPFFETAAPDYDWLNNTVALGRGYLVEGGRVAYQVSALL
jgi:Protein of unknown function (DUF3237)